MQRIGPTAVAESLLLRLSGAPAAGGAVVRAVAVLGDGASLTEVADLAELAEEEVARTADVLVALAILRPGEGLEFAHPIVREAAYTNIGPCERGKAHARGRDPRGKPGLRGADRGPARPGRAGRQPGAGRAPAPGGRRRALRAGCRAILTDLSAAGLAPADVHTETERLHALLDGLAVHAAMRPDIHTAESLKAAIGRHLDALAIEGAVALRKGQRTG